MVAVFFVLAIAAVVTADLSSGSQLEVVREQIGRLEEQLVDLERQATNAVHERQRLNAELELAEARVEELELVLGASKEEILTLRQQAELLAEELELRRSALKRHLEMIVLLGRPGPIQLMYDALRGGELEQAVDTVAVLTSAQVRLIEEFDEMQRQRGRQLASLSQRMDEARQEGQELIERRRQLETVRSDVERKLRKLDKRRQSTGNELADMRSRAEALERLLGVVRSRRSFEGKEDIRRYRGALPWPAEGRVVQTFGKHYLPKYATYTVCNGLRFAVAAGAEVKAVFPGEVAYARHFKGYGNMVVLDHGNEVYSLVAGLATIHVRVSQRVTLGKRLGLAPPSKDEGNLYLEIRVGEKPQDPKRWLLLEEGKS